MKAILTKYIGPSNVKGARVVAYDCDGNRATVSYDYALSRKDPHRAAANALAAKMGWKGRMACGSVKGGYVFVFLD